MKTFETSKALIIVIGLIVLVASLNVIVRRAGPIRWDTTEGDVYTLAEGTLNILNNVEESERPVTIRFYRSDEEDVQLPKEVSEYSKRVEELLEEYAKVSGGAVTVQTYSPVPNSIEEDAAELDGIMRRDPRADMPPTESFDDYDFNQRGRAREPYYFGIAISSLENLETIPYLDPDRETDLEYQISRAISAVIRKEKLKIGLLEGTDIAMAGNPGMMGGRPSPPWVIYNYLQRDFDIESVPFDVQPMEPGDEDHPFYDLDLLLIVHPIKVNRPQPTQPGMPAMGTTTLEPLSKDTQYAIDQFLVRGGKAIAFLDNRYFVSRFFDVYSTTLPFPVNDRHPAWYKDLVNLFDSNGWSHYHSGLDELYKAWGVNLGGPDDPVIYDPKYTRAVSYDRPIDQMVGSEFRLVNQLRQIPNEQIYRQIVGSMRQGPALMSNFSGDALTEDHPVTRGLSAVRMVDAGPIAGKPANGLEMRTLVRSSGRSKAIPGEAVGRLLDRSRTLDQAMAALQSADVPSEHHPVAVLLEGQFKSAFESDPTKVEEEEAPPEPAPPTQPGATTPAPEPRPYTPPVRPPLLPPDAPDSVPEQGASTPADATSPPAPTEPDTEPDEQSPPEPDGAPESSGADTAPEPAEPAEAQGDSTTDSGSTTDSTSPASPSGEPAEGAYPNPQSREDGESDPETAPTDPAAEDEEQEEPLEEALEPEATQAPGEGVTAEPESEPVPSTDADTEPTEEEEEAAEEEEPDYHLVKGSESGSLALISDVDMLFDFFMGNPEAGAVREHDNIAFILNLVETMVGDQNLVNIRGRDSMDRGFTVINEIREKAAARAAGPRKKIREKREQIEQQSMDGQLVITDQGIQYQIDEEKAKKIRQLERERLDLKREEIKIDREQRQEVEAAINRYEWINILLTPLVVVALGLVVALTRKLKTAAR